MTRPRPRASCLRDGGGVPRMCNEHAPRTRGPRQEGGAAAPSVLGDFARLRLGLRGARAEHGPHIQPGGAPPASLPAVGADSRRKARVAGLAGCLVGTTESAGESPATASLGFRNALDTVAHGRLTLQVSKAVPARGPPDGDLGPALRDGARGSTHTARGPEAATAAIRGTPALRPFRSSPDSSVGDAGVKGRPLAFSEGLETEA